MKRGAMLTITDVKTPRFDTYGARGNLPFHSADDRNFRGYSLDDAIKLAVLRTAGESTDVASAAELARRCLDCLAPVHPLNFTDGQDMFAALVRLEWETTPEGHNGLEVVAGRWCDLPDMIAKRIVFWGADGAASALVVSLSQIAKGVFQRARDLGLPEGDHLPPVPKNLDGFPAWFIKAETARRDLFLNWDRKDG